MKNTDKILLKHLFRSSEGLHIYTVYSLLKMPPSQIVGALNALEKNGIIEIAGPQISLSTKGKKFVLTHSASIFSEEKKWREVPAVYIGRRVEPFEPIAPRLKRIRKDFFRAESGR